MEKTLKAFEVLWKIVYGAGCLMITIAAVVALFQILSRYLFANPIGWTEEFITYSIAWMCYIGAPVCLREGKMLGITAVKNLIPGKAGRVVEVFGYLFMLAFLVVMMVLSVQVTLANTHATTSALGLSMATMYIIIPISTFLMIVCVIEILMKDMIKWRKEGAEEC